MTGIAAGSTRVEALAAMSAAFRLAGLPTPDLDARFLVRSCTGGTDVLDQNQASKLHAALTRRLSGEPVDRIIGDAEFWSLRFRLNGDTLSPRPDTECVIELALQMISDRAVPLRILDIGTGTGAILVALLSELPATTGVGIDISESALRMARENSRLNQVGHRCAFVAGNWMEAMTGRFELIVSNPPYIPSGEISGLQIEVRDHDPPRALDGGRDGLDAYRALAAALPRILSRDGFTILEIGAGQHDDVVALMESAGLAAKATKRDLGGHTRALAFHRRG